MSKREAPALKLTVEGGRLVPASAWDQERLLTYRNRSTINAYITQEKPRWMERKYWAILDRVITTCGVKQRTAEDLHDHIKLKLGFVFAKFDDNGKLKVVLKSTKLMEDPEYEGFFEEAMDYLFDLTGVDPLTLKKESADVGEDEHEPSSASPPADDAAAASPARDVAATHSEGELDASNPVGAPSESGGVEPDLDIPATPSSGEEKVAGESETQHGAVLSPAAELECIKKMLDMAADPRLSDRDFAEEIEVAADRWIGVLPDGRKAFVTNVLDVAKKHRKGLKRDAAERYLRGLAA